jgi:hypothetical protein
LLQTGLDLSSHIERKADFNELKTGSRAVQPHVVVVHHGNTVHSCYAVMNSQLFYLTDSIPRAVDLIVKSAFVLDLDYPVCARNSWTFIQKAVYGINTECDVSSTRVQGLISDVK